MNILILHTSAGYGHKKIAENIAAALRTQPGNDIDIKDIYAVESGQFVDSSLSTYFFIISKMPWLWNFFYTNKTFLAATLPLRRPFAGMKSSRLLNILKKKPYDLIISTQVSSSAIVSYLKLKGKYRGKFMIAFSDYHFHPYWVLDNADSYMINIPEQTQPMLELGVKQENIYLCGMTLNPSEKANTDPENIKRIRAKYEVTEGQKVVLMMSGSRGNGIDPDSAQTFTDLDAKIIIVCGTNTQAEHRVRHRFENNKKVKVLGYVNGLNELYAIADIAVTKPGGLTIAECLQYNLPVLVNNFLPSERMNFDYLLTHKLVMPEIHNPNEQKMALVHELATGEFRQSLKTNPAAQSLIQFGDSVREAVKKRAG